MHINLEKFSVNQCAYLLFNSVVALNRSSAENKINIRENFTFRSTAM